MKRKTKKKANWAITCLLCWNLLLSGWCLHLQLVANDRDIKITMLGSVVLYIAEKLNLFPQESET